MRPVIPPDLVFNPTLASWKFSSVLTSQLLLSVNPAGLTSKMHYAQQLAIELSYVDRFACIWPRLSTTNLRQIIL